MARAVSVSGLWTLGFLLSCGARAWFWSSPSLAFSWHQFWVWNLFGFAFPPAFFPLWSGLAVCAGGCRLCLLGAYSGWGLVRVCLGAGCRGGDGYEGRCVVVCPPFSAGGCGLCLGVGWDVASPFLVGFARSAPG